LLTGTSNVRRVGNDVSKTDRHGAAGRDARAFAGVGFDCLLDRHRGAREVLRLYAVQLREAVPRSLQGQGFESVPEATFQGSRASYKADYGQRSAASEDERRPCSESIQFHE
jgi:hypothetical protein